MRVIEAWLLKAFASARSASVSVIMSASLCVRMYDRGSHWTDFREIWYWAFLRKFVEKVQIG
jgi:hypothetical protein